MTKSPIMKAQTARQMGCSHFVGIKERFAANSLARKSTRLRTARDA
jgi:hypothetical protein